MLNEYYVEVVHDESEEVVHSSGPIRGLRTAASVEDGMAIDLDWSRYSLRVVDADGVEVETE